MLGEARTSIAALEASETESLARIITLGSHEQMLIDKNRPFEHDLVTIMPEKERYGAQDVEAQRQSLTKKLSSQTGRSLYEGLRAGLSQIRRETVSPSRVIAPGKAKYRHWGRRRQRTIGVCVPA